MSYYDINAILTDAQKVPCTFEISVPGLGYMDGNSGGDIKKGAKLELPLWLAEMLAISQAVPNQALCTIDMPSAMGPRVINALKADPRTVDLRAQATHFYTLGAKMLDLFDEEEITEVLNDTFKTRAVEIADQAHNPRGAMGDGADFMRGLDETERQLFRAAHDGAKSVKLWMTDMKKR